MPAADRIRQVLKFGSDKCTEAQRFHVGKGSTRSPPISRDPSVNQDGFLCSSHRPNPLDEVFIFLSDGYWFFSFAQVDGNDAIAVRQGAANGWQTLASRTLKINC